MPQSIQTHLERMNGICFEIVVLDLSVLVASKHTVWEGLGQAKSTNNPTPLRNLNVCIYIYIYTYIYTHTHMWCKTTYSFIHTAKWAIHTLIFDTRIATSQTAWWCSLAGILVDVNPSLFVSFEFLLFKINGFTQASE